MNNVICFELNDWFSGQDYPPEEPFVSWIKNGQFSEDAWCKENKLCVVAGNFDMSRNWCIAAPKDWVISNCPKLLGNGQFTYKTIQSHWDASQASMVDDVIIHVRKYADFLRYQDKDGNVYGRFGWPFQEYSEENFGVKFWIDDDEDIINS